MLFRSGAVGSSAESGVPYAGISAAMRKARANDLEKKASPINDRQSSLRRAPQPAGGQQAPNPPVSASLSFDSRRKGAENRISDPTRLDAEKPKYPGACTAIEYREEVRKVWEAIGQLSKFVRYELLSALEKNSQVDARDLAATILQKLEEERRRFDSDEFNDAYQAAAQISKDAADEFRRVIVLLGPTVDPDNVLVKIKEKYAKQDHPPE